MYPWSQTFVNIPPVFQQGKFPSIGLTDLLEEPSLTSCADEMVKNKGGQLTRLAFDQIQELYERPIRLAKEAGLSSVTDVSVQRLMPEMYPSVPGWHCDAVPRKSYTGQPDFNLIAPEAFHVCVILSSEVAGVSNTEYVKTVIKPKIWDKEHVYRDLHREVEKMHPETVLAKDGLFTWFSPKTIHRARPAKRRGIRLMMRYSLYHKPPMYNLINSTQQIYIMAEENGW